MSSSFDEARSAVEQARAALREGRRTEARQLAERAAALAPQMEDPWLILAAVASPRASMEYIGKALKINPNSPRAQRGMQWAKSRLQGSAGEEDRADRRDDPRTEKKSRRGVLYPILLFGLGCLVVAFAAWSAVSSPAVASIMSRPDAAPAAHPHSWARAEILKPTYTPSPAATFTPEPTSTPTAFPTETPPPPPTEQPTLTAEPTYSGTLSIEYVADTPTPAVPTSAPAATQQQYPARGNGEHWIDVDLSRQMLYAYEGDVVVNSFLVSTGTWQTPTVTGQYHVYIKLRYADMSGPGYYLPDVPYVMYFYRDYGLHGTYWHHNFGTPMSHGCVNLQTDDAGWVFNWASVGTLVNVHY
jgi:lipoprotein-anchoring transpeptidase ErfK/SrfK